MFAYKGTFAAATSTGNQTISGIVDENGSSFTPKAILLFSNFQTATGFNDGWFVAMGLTDGTTQMATCTAASDNVAAQRCETTKDTTKLIRVTNSAGTNQRVGTISSFGSGQFVINWTAVTASAEIFHYIAFGGSDLAAKQNNNVFDDTSTTRSADTFSALVSGILALHGFGAPTAGGTGTAIGWFGNKSDGSIPQGTASISIKDNSNPSLCARYQRTDQWKSCFNNGASTLFGAAAKDAFGDAFSANTNSSGVITAALAMGGIAVTAGSGLQPTSTGNQAVTGLGFSPKCVILVSVGQTAQTTTQNEAKFSIGAADRTRQGHIIAGSTHNVTPSVCVTNEDTSHVISCITPNATAGSTTTEAQAAMSSIDADGFTLNWGTADATQREYIWVAFGDTPASSGERSRTFVGAL